MLEGLCRIVKERLKDPSPSIKEEMIQLYKEQSGSDAVIPKCVSDAGHGVANVRKLWGIKVDEINFTDEKWDQVVKEGEWINK